MTWSSAQVHCLLSPATKSPKGVVTNFIISLLSSTSISKPQFSDRQCISIRKVATIFGPNIFILVAVTYFVFNLTTVGYSTFTLKAAGWSSSPIRHPRANSGHPPRRRTTLLSKIEPRVNLLHAYVVFNLPAVGATCFIAIHLEFNREKRDK